jgi:hypothetical protein
MHESKCLACGFTAGPLHHSKFDILNSPLPPLPLRPSCLVPRVFVPSWLFSHTSLSRLDYGVGGYAELLEADLEWG